MFIHRPSHHLKVENPAWIVGWNPFCFGGSGTEWRNTEEKRGERERWGRRGREKHVTGESLVGLDFSICHWAGVDRECEIPGLILEKRQHFKAGRLPSDRGKTSPVFGSVRDEGGRAAFRWQGSGWNGDLRQENGGEWKDTSRADSERVQCNQQTLKEYSGLNAI